MNSMHTFDADKVIICPSPDWPICLGLGIDRHVPVDGDERKRIAAMVRSLLNNDGKPNENIYVGRRWIRNILSSGFFHHRGANFRNIRYLRKFSISKELSFFRPDFCH